MNIPVLAMNIPILSMNNPVLAMNIPVLSMNNPIFAMNNPVLAMYIPNLAMNISISGAVRRHILHRVKANSSVKVDLYVNSELLEPAEDKRLISQIPLKDKMVSSHGNKEAETFF